MRIQLASASVSGPGHVREGLPNQDYVITRSLKGQWLLVVCDGMGSRSESQIGSRAAAKAAVKAIKSLDFTCDDRQIVSEIYRVWLERLAELGIKPADAVTVCLIVWGQSNGEFRYAHLGDGALLSTIGVLSEENTERFSNETTGLGLSKKISDWRFGNGNLRDCGCILTLATDGISEDLTDPEAFCKYLKHKLSKMSVRQSRSWLKHQLTNWPTPGHSDDKSIAIVLCTKD